MMFNVTESYHCEVVDSSLVVKSKIVVLLMRDFKLIEKGTTDFIINSHSDAVTSSRFKFIDEKYNLSTYLYEFDMQYEEKGLVGVDVGFDIGFSVDYDLNHNESDVVVKNIFSRALSSKSLSSSKVTEVVDTLKTTHSLKIIMPHKTEIKFSVNRPFLKEISRWEATFSIYGNAELSHRNIDSSFTVIDNLLLHEKLDDRFVTYGTIDYEHDSKLSLSVYLDRDLLPSVTQIPKISKCNPYKNYDQCDDIMFEEKDFSIPIVVINESANKNISQQLLDCNKDKENFKLGFSISAGVAFIFLIISASLVVNAIRVNNTLKRFSVNNNLESTSW